MKKSALLGCALLVLTCLASAQTKAPAPKRLHLEGPKALQLISILVSGSEVLAKTFQHQGNADFVIHNLAVRGAATQKYDSDAPVYRLALRDARGSLGAAKDSSPINEATALWDFFTSLGLPTSGAMDGSSFQLTSVACHIDVQADIASPKRAQCDLMNGN